MTITMEQFQRAVSERRRERKHGARKYEPELVAFAVELFGALPVFPCFGVLF